MLQVPSWNEYKPSSNYEIGEQMRKKEVISIVSIRANGTRPLDTRIHL